MPGAAAPRHPPLRPEGGLGRRGVVRCRGRWGTWWFFGEFLPDFRGLGVLARWWGRFYPDAAGFGLGPRS
ncbi:MAG: hypothetical protein KF757_13965 [Phycisphaeraceae bacterium]|nr:hypothetical protein [Phycisphaeraceae bacterium]MCW5764068.1 hypothetical protein [Phycisphaeraceae bacterium]